MYVLFFSLLLIAFPAAALADAWGWTYLVDKLVADGVERPRVQALFDDVRIAPFDVVEISVDPPREHRSLYASFRKRSAIEAAHRCRAAHAAGFAAAARASGVSVDVIAAILYVESGCGRNSGSHRIFHRLARLAMANEPQNLERNFDRFRDGDGWLDPAIEARLRKRSAYLERTFYPEVRAVFEVADRIGVDVLDLRGSGSGAFGYPQFLPTSYLSYGVDADADGRVDLFDFDDAAASCGRYLAAHGWHAGATNSQKRAAIWSYNHSEAYIDAVTRLAANLGKPLPTAPKHGKKGKSKARHHTARRKHR